MKRISHHGAYGLLLRDHQILLSQKKSGPYLGLWGLPGGRIEFGESPEQTLYRELVEEVALIPQTFFVKEALSALTPYVKDGEAHEFHHVGIVYQVKSWSSTETVPEEVFRWVGVKEADLAELTPFAKHVIAALKEC